MEAVFARFGYPVTLVTDNSSQFSSEAFKKFCLERGIRHKFSPPYHPQSNGQAERWVDVLKRSWKKLEGSEDPVLGLNSTLLMLRIKPGVAGGSSPAELLLGRKVRSQLSLLRQPAEEDPQPTSVPTKGRVGEFAPGDLVYARDYRGGTHGRWQPGLVSERLGRVRYRVAVGNFSWIRHANQLRRRDAVGGSCATNSQDRGPPLAFYYGSSPRPVGPSTDRQLPPSIAANPHPAQETGVQEPAQAHAEAEGPHNVDDATSSSYDTATSTVSSSSEDVKSDDKVRTAPGLQR